MKLIETGITPMTEPKWDQLNLKDMVKDSYVRFEYYRAGVMFYNILCKGAAYRFPVPLDDIAGATLYVQEKAITYMRYIRKAIEDKTLQEFVPLFMANS